MISDGFGDSLSVSEVVEQEALLSAAPSPGAESLLREALKMVTGVARQMAARYRHLGVDTETLVADGMYGAWLATAKYDPVRGTAWTTYAFPWITRYMTLGVRFHANETTRGDGGDLVSLDAIREALGEGGEGNSADWDPEDTTLPDPDLGIERERVRWAVRHLDPTLRQIVYRSYWVNEGPTEIGRAMNIPKSTVRKRHQQALERLGDRLGAA